MKNPNNKLARASTLGFTDNRPQAVAQRRVQDMIANSPQAQQAAQLQAMADNSPRVQRLQTVQRMINNSPRVQQAVQLQAMADNYVAQRQASIQKKGSSVGEAKPNRTGLPDTLKTGMENLSGMSLDDVKVHYNSSQPAQLQAHAYAQGTDIHLASGQEKHLPHEAWHVVQQKQGRVQPTTQLKGKVNINDDTGLEKEADIMGNRALNDKNGFTDNQFLDKQNNVNSNNRVVQRAVGLEFQTYNSNTNLEIKDLKDDWQEYTEDKEEKYAQGQGVKVEKDGKDLEFVTNAFAESDSGRAGLIRAMRTIVTIALNLERRVTPTTNIHRMAPGLSISTDASDDIRINSAGYIKAQPQATVSVQLNKLSTLLEALKKSGERDSNEDLSKIFAAEVSRPNERKKIKYANQPNLLAKELGKNSGDNTQIAFGNYVYPQAIKLANNVCDGCSPAVKGFVELLGLYIFGSGTKSKYAKSRTPIISRTHLGDVFAKLEWDDQSDFEDKVLPAIYKTLRKNKLDPREPMYKTYPHGEEKASGKTKEEVDRISIESWLRGLTIKQDQLSDLEGLGVISNKNKVEEPDPKDYRQKWFSDAYGADLQMQESTDIGTRESLDEVGLSPHRLNGIVLELRSLGNDLLDISEWATFAVSVFDLMVLTNSNDFNDMIALSKVMLANRSFESDLGDVEAPGIFDSARKIKEKVEWHLISAAMSQGASQEDLTYALQNWCRYVDDV